MKCPGRWLTKRIGSGIALAGVFHGLFRKVVAITANLAQQVISSSPPSVRCFRPLVVLEGDGSRSVMRWHDVFDPYWYRTEMPGTIIRHNYFVVPK